MRSIGGFSFGKGRQCLKLQLNDDVDLDFLDIRATMAGKRLLDAAKIIDASTSIAKQHFAIRRQQWDVYTQTSTLGKAVKNQTDRVTVTANAAIQLAKRLNEDAPSWQQQQDEVKQAVRTVKETAQSYAQGHNTTAGPPKTSPPTANNVEPEVKTQSSEDDGTLSSLRRREQQRQAEYQIPGVAGDAQPVDTHSGEDTFSTRPDSTSPELSSLPRTKLPKHSEEPQDSDEYLAYKELNQDVYYSPTGRSIPPEQSSELNTEIFTSPRVSRMLGQGGLDSKSPYADRKKMPPQPLPEMVAARDRWDQEKKTTKSEELAPAPEPADHDAETQKLAEAIAQEAEQPPAGNVKAEHHEMRESSVPSTRFGRIWQYGGLATSMAFGAIGESFSRLTGSAGTGSLMLSEGNMNRLVAKLSRMRGAALKLGQMMSFQDSKLLPPTINAVLQRVQDSADYMPPWQRNQVLIRNLGDNWADLFSHFEEKPFAAASIGQVHKATLASTNQDVAVKIQYPGVRDSIDSDLNNLSLLLTASRLLPKGLFLDKTIANARTELGWECDYEREAQACTRFADLLHSESTTFTVPKIFTEASGPDVLTAEFLHGTAVTKLPSLTQSERDWIGTQILRLCLRELIDWRFMQTDPNWTNFLYNRSTHKLELLDFGASRDFPAEFVEPYVSLLIAASKHDRASCRDLSIQLGYLTGNESNAMLNAHIDSILTLAEPFTEGQDADGVYDFQDQTITDRVRANIGLMLRERMAPPPEETYSLHRKLSGAFLLCARLGSRVKARGLFVDATRGWK